MIVGHKKQIDFLENARRLDALAGVYCFFGPDEVGKKTVAEKLSADLLGVTPKKLLTHPDFMAVGREKNTKTAKTNKDISVDQIRGINAFLQNHSWHDGWRLVIIDDAHLLNPAAANAFLKTLENPGEKSLIFLISPDRTALPATVLSRAQILNFFPLADREIEEFLAREISDLEQIKTMVSWAWGRPGRARKFLSDPAYFSSVIQEGERWEKIISQPFYERLQAVEDIFGPADGDHIASRESLIGVLDVWQARWREVLLGCNLISKNFSSQQVIRILDDLTRAKTLLRQNIHPRLVVEKILLNF